MGLRHPVEAIYRAYIQKRGEEEKEKEKTSMVRQPRLKNIRKVYIIHVLGRSFVCMIYRMATF